MGREKKPSLDIPKRKHYAAVGRFVASCSSMAIFLNLNMRISLGIEEEIARMMIGIGDLTVKDLITMIKRIQVLKKLSPDAVEIQNRVLSWCSYFNDVRNVVAHKAMYARGNNIYFHNTHTAKDVSKAWTYECTIAQLENASNHIGPLFTCLMMMTHPTWHSRVTSAPDQFQEFPDDLPHAPLLEKQGLPARPADTR